MSDSTTHHYGNITKEKVDAIINGLKNNGCEVSGTNPWNVDTKHSGVKLRGEWNDKTLTLAITITDKAFYVFDDSLVWNVIDPLMHKA
ncbi:MAG: hypothetical protein HQK89_04175 [Nitrospirae bacterium]|nr:hypothetical protein [Nitrospirota bacterium]